jgi:cyclopropane fatty-acyl-phospholipid synthase-like methyltransferase
MNYDAIFYQEQKDGILSSAREVVPIIMKLINPRKVIDVGCGIGAWLSIFKESGVEEILGVDGSWIKKEDLLIPKDTFQFANLEESLTMDRKFDLVVSLEVAEHLSEKSAKAFVDSLVKLGPVVLFSAAIPHQKGIGHKNEQWPEYWKSLFAKNGYVAVDCIRKRIWENKKVFSWYAQNVVIFADKACLDSNENLKEEFRRGGDIFLPLVHPEIYLSKVHWRPFIIQMVPFFIIKNARIIKRLIKKNVSRKN